MKNLLRRFTESAVYRSIFRHGFPDTNRNRSLAVFTNFFLHIHPVKVRRRAISSPNLLPRRSLRRLLLHPRRDRRAADALLPAVGSRAYHDMKDLEFAVSAGVFLRNLHRWSAHAMVALVLAHMAVTFFRGAYRPPRQFNWVIGVLLLVMTVLLSYTGYLLPWDQLAYWAVTVGTNMAQAAPIIGGKLKLLLLGGHTINGAALLRFYVLHCVILPLWAILGLSIHVWRVRKDGGIYLPPVEDGQKG